MQIAHGATDWENFQHWGKRTQEKRRTPQNWLKHCLKSCMASNHNIDFKNGKIINKGNYRHRKTLESWHTAAQKTQTIIQNIYRKNTALLICKESLTCHIRYQYCIQD